MTTFNYNANRGITTILTTKHAQAKRVYTLLVGKKCDVKLIQTRTRSLIKIYQ